MRKRKARPAGGAEACRSRSDLHSAALLLPSELMLQHSVCMKTDWLVERRLRSLTRLRVIRCLCDGS